MIAGSRNSANLASGLRTRYNPRNRIGQGLLSLSPWIDIVFIVIYYALLHGNFVIQPGVVISIPEVPITGGSAPGMTVVVLSTETEEPGVRMERIVFDHAEYQPDDLSAMQSFKKAIARKSKKRPESILILQSDENVAHGTIIQIISIAQEVGIAQVTLATRLVQEDDATP